MPKPTSIRQIAELAGVSKSAVSLALRNSSSISEATRLRILAVADKIGYKVNPLVAALMTQQRSGHAAESAPMIAFIDYYGASDHPGPGEPEGTLPKVVMEHLERTAVLMREAVLSYGYQLDYIRARDAGMTPERLAAIVKSRGVRGIIFLRNAAIAQVWRRDWDDYCVVELGANGIRYHQVQLNQLATVRRLLVELTALGYKRPGLAMLRSNDEPGRFNRLPFMEFYEGKPVEQRVNSLLAEKEWNREVFIEWWRREQPDVVIGSDLAALQWLKEAGAKVPEEVGFACIELLPQYKKLAAGMDGRQDLRTRTAVSVLDGLLRHNETGAPALLMSTTLCGQWVNGPSVRAQT